MNINLSNKKLFKQKCFINGEWINSNDNQTLNINNLDTVGKGKIAKAGFFSKTKDRVVKGSIALKNLPGAVVMGTGARMSKNCTRQKISDLIEFGYVEREKIGGGRLANEYFLVDIGLSKIHRIINYFAKRPQVQERMTVQIFNELKSILNTEDVAVLIDADHLCVSSRGIKDVTSSTITIESGGQFQREKKWSEFLSLINIDK